MSESWPTTARDAGHAGAPGAGGLVGGDEEWRAGVVTMYVEAARMALRRGLSGSMLMGRLAGGLDPRLPDALRERIRRAVWQVARSAAGRPGEAVVEIPAA